MNLHRKYRNTNYSPLYTQRYYNTGMKIKEIKIIIKMIKVQYKFVADKISSQVQIKDNLKNQIKAILNLIQLHRATKLIRQTLQYMN